MGTCEPVDQSIRDPYRHAEAQRYPAYLRVTGGAATCVFPVNHRHGEGDGADQHSIDGENAPRRA